MALHIYCIPLCFCTFYFPVFCSPLCPVVCSTCRYIPRLLCQSLSQASAVLKAILLTLCERRYSHMHIAPTPIMHYTFPRPISESLRPSESLSSLFLSSVFASVYVTVLVTRRDDTEYVDDSTFAILIVITHATHPSRTFYRARQRPARTPYCV